MAFLIQKNTKNLEVALYETGKGECTIKLTSKKPQGTFTKNLDNQKQTFIDSLRYSLPSAAIGEPWTSIDRRDDKDNTISYVISANNVGDKSFSQQTFVAEVLNAFKGMRRAPIKSQDPIQSANDRTTNTNSVGL